MSFQPNLVSNQTPLMVSSLTNQQQAALAKGSGSGTTGDIKALKAEVAKHNLGPSATLGQVMKAFMNDGQNSKASAVGALIQNESAAMTPTQGTGFPPILISSLTKQNITSGMSQKEIGVFSSFGSGTQGVKNFLTENETAAAKYGGSGTIASVAEMVGSLATAKNVSSATAAKDFTEYRALVDLNDNTAEQRGWKPPTPIPPQQGAGPN